MHAHALEDTHTTHARTHACRRRPNLPTFTSSEETPGADSEWEGGGGTVICLGQVLLPLLGPESFSREAGPVPFPSHRTMAPQEKDTSDM